MSTSNDMKLLILFTLFLLPVTGRTWSDMGHRYTGIIAHRYLGEEKSKIVLAVLTHHPDYQEHFIAQMPSAVKSADTLTQQIWLFSQMACWPDLIKRPEFHYSPQLRKWHYINLPLLLAESDERFYKNNAQTNIDTVYLPTDKKENWNIIQALKYQTDHYKLAPDSVKAVMLCWLFHLIGDLAQPLHSSALFNERRFLQGDAGGNSITVKGMGVLHVTWDHATYNAQSNKWSFTDFISYCDTALFDPKRKINSSTVPDQYGTWMLESHKLAREFGYPEELLNLIRISEIMEYKFGNPLKLTMDKSFVADWKKRIIRISNEQISKAGHRIAEVVACLTK